MLNNPFEKAGDRLPPSTSFFAHKRKQSPPEASTETMADLEDRFKTQEYLGKQMNKETLTFFKALAEQIGEEEAHGIASDGNTKIDADGKLTELTCFNTKIIKLPELPEGLTELYCNDCPKLEILPELPAGITELDLVSCPKLEILPELPAGITVLQCSFTGITELPELPEGLTELYCIECPNFERLPELPAGLTELY